MENNNEDLIPFEKLKEQFKRKYHYFSTLQSSKITTEKQFDKFNKELEDLMVQYGVYTLAAALFADL